MDRLIKQRSGVRLLLSHHPLISIQAMEEAAMAETDSGFVLDVASGLYYHARYVHCHLLNCLSMFPMKMPCILLLCRPGKISLRSIRVSIAV